MAVARTVRTVMMVMMVMMVKMLMMMMMMMVMMVMMVMYDDGNNVYSTLQNAAHNKRDDFSELLCAVVCLFCPILCLGWLFTTQ